MEPGILQLEVLKGPKKSEILVCKPESKVQIGRVKKGNDFAIRDPGISQKHLSIQYVPQSSRWFVSDMDSSNGTIHNGSKIEPLVPVLISDGDVIKIGEKVELGVKIVLLVMVKENGGVKAMKVYTRRCLAKDCAKAGSSRGTEEEDVRENVSKVSVPVRNCAQASEARVSNEEEASVHKKDQKGKGRGQKRNNAKENAGSGFVEEMKENRDFSVQIGEPYQSGVKLRRNPRRGNSSKALTELDMNRTIGVGVEGKGVHLKKMKGKGEVTEVPHGEIHHSDDSLLDSDCINITEKGKGLKGKETVSSPMVTEEEKGDGHTGLKEGLEVDSKAKDQIENMTVEQWFDSMALFLRKAIQDEAAEIINNLKEKARKFDEFKESGSDV